MNRLVRFGLIAALATLAACADAKPAVSTGLPDAADASPGQSDAASDVTKTDATASDSTTSDATASDATDAADTAVKPGDTATIDTTPPKDTAPVSDKCAPDDSQCMNAFCFPQDVPGPCTKEVVQCIGINLKCKTLYDCVSKCQSDPKYPGPDLPKDVTPPADPTQVTCAEKCVLYAGDKAASELADMNKCVISKCIDCNKASNKQQCVSQCALVQCIDKLEACQKNTECSATYTCLAKCGQTDAKCQGACLEKATPKAQEMLTDFNSCAVGAQTKCQE